MAGKNLRHLQATVTGRHVRLCAYRGAGWDAASVSAARLRLYRAVITDFEFNRDNQEFFDGLRWQDAKVIHDGPPAGMHGTKLTVTDDQVELGGVYAYWLAAQDAEPIGPAAVKVRDPEVWWSAARLTQEIGALEQDHPGRVTVECIGRTALGRPLHALRVGNTATAVGLVGLVHAGEAGPELILPAIRHMLEHHHDLLQHVGVVAVPAVNIDQRQRMVDGTPWYLRTNAHGVDLNRNFPADWDEVSLNFGLDTSDPDSITYRGPRPASEPETQALMSLFERCQVNVVYSFHCLASICGGWLLPPARGESDPPYRAACERLGTAYACAVLKANLPPKEVLSFGTAAGSLPAWFHHRNIPAFDMEIQIEHEADALARCQLDQTDLSLLHDYRQRHMQGLLAAMRTLAGQKMVAEQ